jgi:hypothetical protein
MEKRSTMLRVALLGSPAWFDKRTLVDLPLDSVRIGGSLKS